MKPKPKPRVTIRNTQPRDFDGIIDLCRRVYTSAPPWDRDQLQSHLDVFPEGQFVAEEVSTGRIVGMAASLIVLWNDYEMITDWRDFTDRGYFTNHDPEGRTLYAAEVMVDPDCQGCGIGKKLYKARRDLCRRLGLKRIRAGARLRHYSKHAELTPEQYVMKIIHGELSDPTLSFQISQGFQVIGIAPNYLPNDPASQGHAAVIEWINHKAAQKADYAPRPTQFKKPRRKNSE